MSKRREWIGSLNYKKQAKNFVLPMLDIKIAEYGPYLIDCCVEMGGFPQIVIILDNSESEQLKMLVYKLQLFYSYLDSDFDDDQKEIVMKFDVPVEYKKDFEHFLSGSYSKFSDLYKNKLIKLYGRETCAEFAKFSMFDVIHPTEKKRKERAESLNHNEWQDIKEVLSKPDLEFEEYKKIEELYDKAG